MSGHRSVVSGSWVGVDVDCVHQDVSSFGDHNHGRRVSHSFALDLAVLTAAASASVGRFYTVYTVVLLLSPAEISSQVIDCKGVDCIRCQAISHRNVHVNSTYCHSEAGLEPGGHAKRHSTAIR